MYLKNKVALVTGGSRGIGAAAAKLLSARGANVVVNYLNNAEAARKVAGEIEEAGGKALALQGDVRSPEEVQKLVKKTIEVFGHIDILVSNAHMNHAMKPISELTWEEFSDKLNSELRAAFELTKCVVPHMKKQQYGKLVYIASSLAKSPIEGFAAHGTAKAAIVAFTRYAAQEFGPFGITANAVLPGMVDTDLNADAPAEFKKQVADGTPLGRIAQAEDVAGAIAFLVSDDSRFITGKALDVNGGILMD